LFCAEFVVSFGFVTDWDIRAVIVSSSTVVMYSVVRLSGGRTETASCVWLCEMLSVGYTISMEVIWLCELLYRETGYCLHNCAVLQGWSNHRRRGD
jgi:hypothetical protein